MEAVDRLRETERRVSDLEALTREQGSALWGDNVRRDNGVRSKVQAHDAAISGLQEQMLTIKSEWRHYIDVGRKESCEGLKALAQFEAKADDEAEEDADVTVANINAQAMLEAAEKAYKGQVRSQAIMLIATLASPPVTLLAAYLLKLFTKTSTQ